MTVLWALMETVMVEVGGKGWMLPVLVLWECWGPCAYFHGISDQALL